MLEETGLVVKIGPMIWHVEEVSEERGQRFVNFFLAQVIGGKMELGEDPEFDNQHQTLREVTFFSREDVAALPNVYPEFLREELWEVLGKGPCTDAFKVRR